MNVYPYDMFVTTFDTPSATKYFISNFKSIYSSRWMSIWFHVFQFVPKALWQFRMIK